jgi:hypothetical protein
MAAPPPASWCPHGLTSLLRQREDAHVFRAGRLACRAWRCAVCCRRLAYSWARHLEARLATTQEEEELALVTGDVLARRRDSFARRLRQFRGRPALDYLAVDGDGGLTHYLVAVPDPAALPYFGAVSLDYAVKQLCAWLTALRPTTPQQHGNRRPVTTSWDWSLSRHQPTGSEWLRLGPIACRHAEPVLAVLRAHGLGGTVKTAPSSAHSPRAWLVAFVVPATWDDAALAALEEALLACRQRWAHVA